MNSRKTLWAERTLAAALLLGGLPLAPLSQAVADTTAPVSQAAKPDEFRALVRDAYHYAYPLVLMDITRQQMTNVADAHSVPQRAPINQFAHYRQYPDAQSKEVVRFNFDTLYSMAWIDVSQEPMVLSVPDSQGRYYLAPMLDMWTDVFAVPGTRTTGGKAGHFALAAPGWSGELPAGVELIQVPTPVLWLLGRTQTNGPGDYANVHKVQDQFRLVPLSQWDHDYQPPSGLPVDPQVDNRTPPLEQVNRLSGVELLDRFARLLQQYPAHASDYPILHRMRALGIEPGKDFEPSRFTTEKLQAIDAAAQAAQEELRQIVRSAAIGALRNGWNWSGSLGSYGTDYRKRAVVALAGLGANLPEDAIYPNAVVDAEGKPLSGQHAYLLRFEAGQLPPVDAFWSLTLYDKDGFQVANPLERFALGSYDQLKFGSDGSLELRIQAQSPGKELEANWLPAPRDNFQLMLRMYSPQPAMLSGQWQPPAIRRVD